MAWVAIPNEDGSRTLVHSDLCDDYLAHHGIKGQKWGVRRYQNKAGTKKHKRASSKKSGKQRKANSKITNRSKLYKDRGALNWRLLQEIQDNLQRIQNQMMQDQMLQQQQQNQMMQDQMLQQQQQNQMIQQQNQMMQDQIWQQQINDSIPMFF